MNLAIVQKFMVRLEEDKPAAKTFSEETFRQDLSKWGDSLLVVSDDEIVKVHIHAEHPGEVLKLRAAIWKFN